MSAAAIHIDAFTDASDPLDTAFESGGSALDLLHSVVFPHSADYSDWLTFGRSDGNRRSEEREYAAKAAGWAIEFR